VIRTILAMGTTVTIHVVADDNDAVEARVERAFRWIREVEARCTRFDTASELRQLTASVGHAVPVSDILFEAVRFAVAVAEASGGAFDPTVGGEMQRRGFNRHYRTGAILEPAAGRVAGGSFRDLCLDPVRRTILVAVPLMLDLGAVAKGLAVDLAARELAPLGDFAIDAGGDLWLSGRGPGGAPWTVGIRHPREDRLLCRLTVTDAAVCTSGDYERTTPAGHHLVDPRPAPGTQSACSATVIAPGAMTADALATAAFVLGPAEGVPWLEAQGVEGLIVSSSLEQHATRGFGAAVGGPAVLRDAEGSAHHPPDFPLRAGGGERRGRTRRSGAA
jgi:thiamine biosynthesis lipoprotein